VQEEEEVGGVEEKEKSGRMLGFAKRFIILDYFDNVGQRKHEGWLELERTREKIKQGRDGWACLSPKSKNQGENKQFVPDVNPIIDKLGSSSGLLLHLSPNRSSMVWWSCGRLISAYWGWYI
jgi:hypothetical protein